MEKDKYLKSVEVDFEALREAIDEFLAYSRSNRVAMPRALLYEAILQSRCGAQRAAIVTVQVSPWPLLVLSTSRLDVRESCLLPIPSFQAALQEAILLHMPYEEALCCGELGMLTEDIYLVDEVVAEADVLFPFPAPRTRIRKGSCKLLAC